MRHLLSKNQQMKHLHLLKHEMIQSFHSEKYFFKAQLNYDVLYEAIET